MKHIISAHGGFGGHIGMIPPSLLLKAKSAVGFFPTDFGSRAVFMYPTLPKFMYPTLPKHGKVALGTSQTAETETKIHFVKQNNEAQNFSTRRL